MSAKSDAVLALIDLITVQQSQAQLGRVLSRLKPKDPLHAELHKALKGLELVLSGLMERSQ